MRLGHSMESYENVVSVVVIGVESTTNSKQVVRFEWRKTNYITILDFVIYILVF